MEEINLKELMWYLYRKKLIIIISTFIIVSVSMIYFGIIREPKYVSSTTLILTGFSADNGNEINPNDFTINSKLVGTYQEITKTRKVLNQVINNLGLDYTASELANHISVTKVNDAEMIKISVSDKNAELACKIADEIALIFSQEVKEIYNVSNITIIDVAEIASSSSNISFLKATLISFILGFILSLGIVFIIFYFDNTIKSVEQLEEKFDVPILGTIPTYNTGKGGRE